jgi:hypothetical protein
MASNLILRNRQENLKVLLDFIREWAKEHGLSASRQAGLERAASQIFQHLVTRTRRWAYPGAIAVGLDKYGSRLRLRFEVDAPPYRSGSSHGSPTGDDPGLPLPANGLEPQVESLIYYRTANRKNRMVLFLSPEPH